MLPEAKTRSNPSESAPTRPTAAPPSALKERCRRAVASGLFHTGLLSILRKLEGKRELTENGGGGLPRLRPSASSKFCILCYHRVGTEGVPFFSRLAPEVFEAQMQYLRRHYRIVSLSQMCREVKEGSAVPSTLAITFDDGYRDLYSHAFPVLQKYEIPATIYLIGNCMETGEAPWYDRIFVALGAARTETLELELSEPRTFVLSDPAARAAAAWEIVCYLRSVPDMRRREWCASFERQVPVPAAELEGRMLDWNHVRTMQRGGVCFGAHTMSHPSVSRLAPSDLREELSGSKKLLENGLQVSVEHFAYPFGKPSDCSDAAENLFSQLGFLSAVTTTAGPNTSGANPFRLCRMQIGDDRSIPSFAFEVSRMFLSAQVLPQVEVRGTSVTNDVLISHENAAIGKI